jgi:transposase
MIPLPSGVRVWLATGYTDMRKGFPSLALTVQEVLRCDPLSGHLFCFRGWPGVADGVVTISPAQLGYLLSGIDWRHPQETWRPNSMG